MIRIRRQLDEAFLLKGDLFIVVMLHYNLDFAHEMTIWFRSQLPWIFSQFFQSFRNSFLQKYFYR